MAADTDVKQKVCEARQQTRAAAQSLTDLAHAFMLVGIGAVALTKDESKALVDKLVERGAVAEQEARKTMGDLGLRSRMGGRQGRIEKRIEAVLSRMSIPSREEVTRLSDRIAALSARIDALTAEQGNKPS